jgi:ribosome-binding factor A
MVGNRARNLRSNGRTDMNPRRSTGRVARVQKLAKEVLGEAVQDLKDPRVGFATVTAVRMSADLQHARVLVSVYGTDEEKRDTMKGLRSAVPHLRMELGKQMRMKQVPELHLELDEGPEEAERLEAIFRRLEGGQTQADANDTGGGKGTG